MLYVKGITTTVKNAETASSNSSHFILARDFHHQIPTTISAGAVAADVTIPAIGDRNNARKKNNAVKTDVRPVLPPTLILQHFQHKW